MDVVNFMNVLERIIWSADVKDEAALMVTLDSMPELQIVKIDRMLLEVAGFGLIDRLNERGIKTFDDAKIIEIPSKIEGIVKNHLAHKPWMVNCMAHGVSSMVLTHEDRDKIDGLKRFADACNEVGTKSCAVSVLTSKTSGVVEREYNGRNSMEQVLEYVEMLLTCGFTDVVCSPKELSTIRAESRFDTIDLNTPGIRLASSDVGDQARISTPESAFENGATRLVIGRPITQGNPAENLRNIAASCQHLSMFQKAG